MTGASNFPQGFLQGATIRGVPLTQSHPGEIFFLNSTTVLAKGGVGSSDGNKGTYKQPFATLAKAISACLAGRGDIIMAMPGHAESISTATALAANVAGVVVISLGHGTLRANFTLDTATTTTIAISAANFTFKNIIFTANFADIADLFTPTAVNAHCEDCVFQSAGADLNFVEIFDTSTVDNEVDSLSFLRCNWIDPDLATTSFGNVDADIDQLSIVDCSINIGVNTSDLPILVDVAAGKDLTNLNIVGNTCIRLNDANPLLVVFADTTTTNTGIIADNKVSHRDVTAPTMVTAGTNIAQFNNESSDAIDSSGVVIPSVEEGEAVVVTAAAVMVTNDDIFTIAGGPIEILSLVSVCTTTNDATASTLQYEVDPTTGVAVTISAASASLANAVAGGTITLRGTALSTAALFNASGGNLGATIGIVVTEGVISVVIGVGSTTGTWTHHLRYRPLAAGVTVVPA